MSDDIDVPARGAFYEVLLTHYSEILGGGHELSIQIGPEQFLELRPGRTGGLDARILGIDERLSEWTFDGFDEPTPARVAYLLDHHCTYGMPPPDDGNGEDNGS